jgi:transcriptional regulator with XRE-family HTH domain
MNFGQNLRNLRKSKNISQEELAERVKVSRQSVSKWETGEAYPEMNNILELCKIFHCHINDLVNDNILDIDSLDEDVKMSAVKFKKEKQKQMKGISKVLSLIGKIAGIVARVAIGFVIVAMVSIPFLLKDIDVRDGKIVSNNKTIQIVQYEKGADIRISGNTIATNIKNEDTINLANSIKKYTKPGVITLMELGFSVLVGFLVVLVMLLKHLEELFSNVNKGETPFTLDNVKHIKMMTYFMIAAIVLSGIGEGLFDVVASKDVDFGLSLFSVVEILFLYSMSLIFEYGHEIQLDSKGKIYGDENE